MQSLDVSVETQSSSSILLPPQSRVSNRKAPADFRELLSLSEDLNEGVWTLCKLVHMPQDRDILFIVWRRKQEYQKPCYSPSNGRHTFEAVREWKRTLIRCQAWYFSILLRERCFSKEELKRKIEPFLSQDGGRHLLAPTMLKAGKKIIAGEKLSELPVPEQANFFINYAADTESDELEGYARISNSINIEAFIDTVKKFFLGDLPASPRSPFAQNNRPALPVIKWAVGTVSRDKLRKDCGPDDTSSQEEWIADILSKRADLRAALILVETPKERASLLGFYSRTQLCGILVAFFSHSKEPVGDRMLNATLNKQGLARIAGEVLVIHSSVHIHNLHVRDHLTSHELSDYIKFRAASGEVLSQQRELFESYRVNERHTTRMFWNKKAHSAARRQLHTDHPPQEKVDELTWLFEDIFRQQEGLCLYCFALLRTSKGKAWNNASPDRRISAKRGGEYDRANVDIACVGCQFSKWWYKPSEFRVLLLAMANAQWKASGSLLKSIEPATPVPMSTVEQLEYAGPWCKKALSTMQVRKECQLDFETLEKLLQSRWVGTRLLLDDAGVIAPLETMSIDRLDSSGSYRKDNARLLLWGLNSLKGADVDDLNVIRYLQHLRENRAKINAEVGCLPEDERRLPLQ